ncbi:MAG: transcription termination factor Rho [Puniceicoccales bacterium]|jgi:transcription termination factor Rho|nr:transcription termination factor Rho [Puniceicoccales bacterium]
MFEDFEGDGGAVLSFDERHGNDGEAYQSLDGAADPGGAAEESRPREGSGRPRGRGRSGRREPAADGAGYRPARGHEKVQVLPEENSLPPNDPFAADGIGGIRGGGGPVRGNRFRGGQRPAQGGRLPQRGGGNGEAHRGPRPAGGLRRNHYGGLGFWEKIQSESALESARGEFFSDAVALELEEVVNLNGEQMAELAASLEMAWEPSLRSQVLENCLRHAVENRTAIAVCGTLELLADGNGCLVWARDRFEPSPLSPFVPRCLIRSCGLRRGQELRVLATYPRSNGTHLCALALDRVMDRSPAEAEKIPNFKELVPYYPTDRLLLENGSEEANQRLSLRIVDLVSPIGLGQRGLIVAPPRTGKTVLLQAFANGIATVRPDAHVWILLIDERPEEVTDFRRMAKGEVFASTFDETPDRHVRLAEMVIEMARRRVECGQHVVILLDSITRLARAYNAIMPASGRIMSGGIDANALQGPKSFFGSARNIEGGGSLTILGTALVETGSRMDDVIFEEFKGTGNMELQLDRELADRRIYPAINVGRSGTRKEELLYHPDELSRIYLFRRAVVGLNSTEAVDMLIQRVKKTNTNVEFLMTLNRG